MWQDYVLMAIQIFFCFTLIPILFAEEKPPLISSIPTGLALFISAAILATLNLWLTMFFQIVMGAQWLTLAWQKWQMKTPSR